MPILRCKVLLLGDSKVGKTALAQCFHKGGAEYRRVKNYVMTEGVDVNVKEVAVPDSQAIVELYMFDVSGHELFSRVRHKYYNGAAAVMFCYDVARRESFLNIRKWIKEYRQSQATKPLRGVLVGCKSDLNEHSEIKQEELTALAEEYNLSVIDTSALDGTDTDAPFNYLAAAFHERYERKIAQFAQA